MSFYNSLGGLRGLIPDSRIKQLSLENQMIEPFVEEKTDNDVISYGLSSYGYDATLAKEISYYARSHLSENFVNVPEEFIDPKNINDDIVIKHQVHDHSEFYQIPPHGFILARTNEYFKIPKNILAVCVGKSTYARCGLIVNVTPLEPGWEGHVTLEISNTTDLPARIYYNEGICQFLFFENIECENDYTSGDGKYQGQTNITLPKIKTRD